jgi:hypothetical protein
VSWRERTVAFLEVATPFFGTQDSQMWCNCSVIILWICLLLFLLSSDVRSHDIVC